jgi:hypothetical protein
MHKKSRTRKMRGGSYTDAASYGMYVNGTTGSQWSRTMDQAGPYGQVHGNVIIGAQGQNVTPTTLLPNSGNLNLIQSGAGSRRRRGGFLGEVVNQAIVPLAILGAQQSYGRRKRGGKTHKKRRGKAHKKLGGKTHKRKHNRKGGTRDMDSVNNWNQEAFHAAQEQEKQQYQDKTLPQQYGPKYPAYGEPGYEKMVDNLNKVK